ncbi:MAG: hypothetical protein CML06_14300 [Pseudomonadales bacterium]|nr:hypothetical protein [Pseudomonadales bacterium]
MERFSPTLRNYLLSQLCLCFLLFLPTPAQALPPVTVSDTFLQGPSAIPVQHYLDPSAELSIHEIRELAPESWPIPESSNQSYGFDQSPLWVRLQVRNEGLARQLLMLDPP